MQTAAPFLGLLGARVRLADDVDYEGGVLHTPRRNRIERCFARLVHPGRTGLKVRVALDEKGRRVMDAIQATGRGGAASVRSVAASLGIEVPVGDGTAIGPDLAAFLVFLGSLVRSRVLVAEPI